MGKLFTNEPILRVKKNNEVTVWNNFTVTALQKYQAANWRNTAFSDDLMVAHVSQNMWLIMQVIIQGTHKRMVQFQKLTRNLFLTLNCQQWQLSKFPVRYQQFASHAYCWAAGPVSKMASQQEKAFCVLHFEASRSVITVQHEFRAWFRKDAPCMVCLGNWPRSPAVSMRRELLVAHGKLGQLPLLRVYVVPV